VNDNTPTQISQFVLRRLTETVTFLGREFDGWIWMWILIPLLLVGLVYVVWMYIRDGHSIGWIAASCLALLRLTVYAILAGVFLLPAIQNWEETRTQSRVVLGLDTSTSMVATRDEVPSEGVSFEKMPTRQDKVLNLLTDTQIAFLKRLQERNPVFAYRWGVGVDEQFKVLNEELCWERKEWEDYLRLSGDPNRPRGKVMTRENWNAWLKPEFNEQAPASADEDERKALQERQDRLRRLFAGTNVGESSLGLLTREINNMVQGLVLFTDGRSTQESPQAFRDLADRARRASIPVFVVAVGEDRIPVRIDIADARGPDVARPEDPFPVSIDVTGEGLANREVSIYLDVYKPGSKPGKDTPFRTLEKRVTFKPSQPPRVQAEFPISPAEYGEVQPEKPEVKPGITPEEKPEIKLGSKPGRPELAAGDWLFVPRVPRDRGEIFTAKEHTREPLVVKVVKRPMRVLLFASGPAHDYQFLRSLMVRESDNKRVELCIYLQGIPGQPHRTGIVQDVPPEHMLTRFPDRLDTKGEDDKDRIYNLANYDAIVAFDPDWSELTREQAQMVEQWVSQQGGGLIVVAGPVNTLELARPGASGFRVGTDPQKIKPILDVYPVVLKDARLEKERSTAEPVRLRFSGADPEMEFLKLDDENPKSNPLEAWNDFFMGAKGSSEAGQVVRGFYSFYPVQKAKEGCITVATFSDPFVQDAAGREQPYLVIQPRYGRGRVVWLGSGETRRLRGFREVWFDRFWLKLCRYVSSSSVGQGTRRIIPNMGKTFAAGKFVEVQAQMFGRDLKPLPQYQLGKPTMTLKLPPGLVDKTLPANYEMTPRATPGEWEGWFVGRFLVKWPGEHQLEIRLPDSNEVSVTKFNVVEVNPELENTRPDFEAIFELASEADDVLARVNDDQVKSQIRQALQRMRPPQKSGDKPLPASERDKLRLVFDLRTASLIPECMLSRQITKRNRGPVQDLWDGGWTMWTENAGSENERPVKFSYVLAAVVALLSIEWLTRKLMRLA
jgi:hypothetical protein